MSHAPGALRLQIKKQVKCVKIYLWNVRIAVWISCLLNVGVLEDKPHFLQEKLFTRIL